MTHAVHWQLKLVWFKPTSLRLFCMSAVVKEATWAVLKGFFSLGFLRPMSNIYLNEACWRSRVFKVWPCGIIAAPTAKLTISEIKKKSSYKWFCFVVFLGGGLGHSNWSSSIISHAFGVTVPIIVSGGYSHVAMESINRCGLKLVVAYIFYMLANCHHKKCA